MLAMHGWTLLELMIVVLIVAVLSGYALTSYHRHLARGYRFAAVVALYRAACFVQSGWDGAGGHTVPALPETLTRAPPSGRPVYRIVLRTANDRLDTYTVEAVPVAGGPLDHDARCGVFVLDSLGQRANRVDGQLLPDAPAECWP